MFEEYENYLSEIKEFDNYWSDVGITEAIRMLERFSGNDWKNLNEKIQSKSKAWLISCAETLGDDVGGNNSFNLLLKLLSSESDEVKIAALDSINSRLSLGFALGDSAEEIRSAIKAARSSAGIVASMVLDSLEKRLGQSWIEAEKLLADNPARLVSCPVCANDNLRVTDHRSAETPNVVEREMHCPSCGTQNFLRLVRPLDI